jgi:hypothetical protein
MDAFEQENLDLTFVERSFGHCGMNFYDNWVRGRGAAFPREFFFAVGRIGTPGGGFECRFCTAGRAWLAPAIEKKGILRLARDLLSGGRDQ